MSEAVTDKATSSFGDYLGYELAFAFFVTLAIWNLVLLVRIRYG